MKRIYIKLVSVLVTSVILPTKIRDFFIWPLASRVLGISYSEVHALKAGFKFHAYMGDHLGRLALFYGEKYEYFWEPTTTQLIEKLLPKACHALIAGSHAGLTVLYAKKAMHAKDTSVHAFEPISDLFEISKRNFELNEELGSIMLEKKALGDSLGFVTMTSDRIRSHVITSEDQKSDSNTEQVQVTTIDSYCALNKISYLDFILLDVEGYEYNALRGAQGLLKKNAPKDIIYEVIRSKDETLNIARQIEILLQPYGYTFYIISDSEDPLETPRGALRSIRLISASELAYKSHLNHRYFNVYATLRGAEEISSFAEINQ